MKKNHLVASLCLASAAISLPATAQLSMTLTNLTQGIHFTPLAFVAHTADNSLFEVGEAASSELQAMAEGGDLSGLASIASAISADVATTDGLLGPGQSVMADLPDSDTNNVLSVVAMMLPTNDGFVGLDNWAIPTEAGTYTVYLNAYDAGTEANDEIQGGGAPGTPGFPVPPPLAPLVGSGGTGVTSDEANMTVHIHRGNLGDADAAGGASDINNSVQRWLNPVAKLTIVVE